MSAEYIIRVVRLGYSWRFIIVELAMDTVVYRSGDFPSAAAAWQEAESWLKNSALM